jgi:hypothetical protein
MNTKCVEWIYSNNSLIKSFSTKNETMCHLNVGAFEDMVIFIINNLVNKRKTLIIAIFMLRIQKSLIRLIELAMNLH